MVRERCLFTEEFKREAVKLVNQPGATKAAIGRDLGVGPNLVLMEWTPSFKRHRGAKIGAVPAQGHCGAIRRQGV